MWICRGYRKNGISLKNYSDMLYLSVKRAVKREIAGMQGGSEPMPERIGAGSITMQGGSSDESG